VQAEWRELEANQKKTQALLEEINGRGVLMQDVLMNEFSSAFIQHCLTPRVRQSPSDSIFCLAFIAKMVELVIDKANVLHIFSQINKIFYPIVQCCTNKESENIGLFLSELFHLLEHKLCVSEQVWVALYMDNPSLSQTVGKPNPAQFARFQDIIRAMHLKLGFNLDQNLKSAKYHRVKNSITILQRMRQVFPKRQESWELLDQTFTALRKDEDKFKKLENDLQTKLVSYHEWLKVGMYDKFPDLKPMALKREEDKTRDKSPATIRRERFQGAQRDDRRPAERNEPRKEQTSSQFQKYQQEKMGSKGHNEYNDTNMRST